MGGRVYGEYGNVRQGSARVQGYKSIRVEEIKPEGENGEVKTKNGETKELGGSGE
jgi:hypothetical protein